MRCILTVEVCRIPTLYELTAEFEYLYNLLTSGEIDDQTFTDSLEGMGFDQQLEAKVENCAKIITMLKADAEAARAESKRLDTRKNALLTNAERINNRLFEAMKVMAKDKIKTPLFTVSIRATPPKVVVSDLEKLQANVELWKPRKWDEKDLDKTKIKELLKSNIDVPGASLKKGETLRIE